MIHVPDKKITIEVDGKFHNKHKQHDNMRTRDIQEQYPNVEVLRFQWEDLTDDSKMNFLLGKIK